MPPKQKLLSKRQLKYLRDRLGSLDKEVMLIYIVKEMDEKEAVHIDYYPSRKELWKEWKSTEKLKILLEYFHERFVILFKQHSTGKQEFSRLLLAWNYLVGSLACSSLGDNNTEAIWSSLALPTATAEDRSATVFAVANCFYTFIQKHVCFLCFTCIFIVYYKIKYT